MPGPSSLTRSSTQSPRSCAATRTALPSGATSSALFRRLSTTCSRRPGVARAAGVPVDRGVDVHVLLGGERVPRVATTVDHLVDRDRHRRRCRLLGTGEHEQSVDQSGETRHFVERALEVFGRSAVHVGFEVFQSQSHGRERRAQLVRRVGDEPTLSPDQGFETRRGGVERFGEHGEFGRPLGDLGPHRQIAAAE